MSVSRQMASSGIDERAYGIGIKRNPTLNLKC